MEKKMETTGITGLERCYIGIQRGFIWGHIGLVGKKMETTKTVYMGATKGSIPSFLASLIPSFPKASSRASTLL